jgi:hypothetical protein
MNMRIVLRASWEHMYERRAYLERGQTWEVLRNQNTVPAHYKKGKIKISPACHVWGQQKNNVRIIEATVTQNQRCQLYSKPHTS